MYRPEHGTAKSDGSLQSSMFLGNNENAMSENLAGIIKIGNVIFQVSSKASLHQSTNISIQNAAAAHHNDQATRIFKL